MKKWHIVFLCFGFLLFTDVMILQGWGFWGHQRINQKAIFCLPQPLMQFFKENSEFITKHAVDPDMRRYADPEEAPRHFIDIDHYGITPFDSLPRHWKEAVSKIGEDSLKAHGIVPYHIQTMLYRLTLDFQSKDFNRVLKDAAEIGHYIGDAHVPLHCTSNYNGQKTGQHGIHGFWESRIPELFGDRYDYLVGKAEYLSNPSEAVWNTIKESYAAKDSVLMLEALLNRQFDADKKYSYESKGSTTVKVYSREYTEAYNQLLCGMVERRMRKAIHLTASFWYTAWINAGMPNLPTKKVNILVKDSIEPVGLSPKGRFILKGHDDE